MTFFQIRCQLNLALISPKKDKSGTLSYQFSVHFGVFGATPDNPVTGFKQMGTQGNKGTLEEDRVELG